MPLPYHPKVDKDGRFRGYGWFYVPSWNITIAAPPKGGSSSLKRFMQVNEVECSYLKQHEVRGPCFFVVRDPVSRFFSLWRSKCRDRKGIVNAKVQGMSPSQLLEYIESGAKDVHWTPQISLIGNLKPRLIPLERLTEWWAQQGYGELNVYNSTEGPVDINPKRIIDFYSQDMKLYAEAVLQYNEV